MGNADVEVRIKCIYIMVTINFNQKCKMYGYRGQGEIYDAV